MIGIRTSISIGNIFWTSRFFGCPDQGLLAKLAILPASELDKDGRLHHGQWHVKFVCFHHQKGPTFTEPSDVTIGKSHIFGFRDFRCSEKSKIAQAHLSYVPEVPSWVKEESEMEYSLLPYLSISQVAMPCWGTGNGEW